MRNYFILCFSFMICSLMPDVIAATLCNQQLDVAQSQPHLPLDTVVRIASPLKKSSNSPYYGHGSGVLVNFNGKHGFVLSASHVTASHPLILVSLQISPQHRRILWAKFIKEDKKLDLSLYKIIDLDFINNSAQLFEGDNENYQQALFTVGYPITLNSLTKAELFPNSKLIIRRQNLVGVSEYLGLGLAIKPLVLSDCIETGLSGGPVFDHNGRLFGINHSTDRYKNSFDSPVNGYIVSSSYILQFLK